MTTAASLALFGIIDFDFVVGTNVKGAFFVAQEVAQRMIARGKGQADFRGRIVNIASVAGKLPGRSLRVRARRWAWRRAVCQVPIFGSVGEDSIAFSSRFTSSESSCEIR